MEQNPGQFNSGESIPKDTEDSHKPAIHKQDETVEIVQTTVGQEAAHAAAGDFGEITAHISSEGPEGAHTGMEQSQSSEIREDKSPATDEKENQIVQSESGDLDETATSITQSDGSSEPIRGPGSYAVDLDVDTDETDSALGDVDRPFSSVSVTSSVYKFVQEFGRTYHSYKEGKNFLPNDEIEQNRLNLQHTISCMLLGGKLHLAPLQNPNRVIDIGTGTGIWAIEFADTYPESDVVGTDLSPIQPEYIPPNCRFEVDDAEDEWAFTEKFDFIHGRYMSNFLRDWPQRFRTFYENLNPGGWVEFQETIIFFQATDDSLEGTALQRWNQLLLKGIKKLGRDGMSSLSFEKWMREAGFSNITEQKKAIPGNPWAKGRDEKLLGAMQMTNVLEGVPGMTLTVFTRALGWSVEEVEVFLVDVRRDIADRNIHSYVTNLTVCGQKPL